MSTAPPKQICPKCSAPMELGLLIDSTFRSPSRWFRGCEQVLEWVRGTPNRSYLTLAFKSSGADRLQVATLRCTHCAFLELYAPDAPANT